MKKNRLLFLLLFLGIIYIGFIKVIVFPNEINDYENRSANKFAKLSINNIINKNFQNSTDSTLSDQIPLAIFIKKGYNFLNNYVSKEITVALTRNKCQNKYIKYSNSVTAFGCNDNLVFLPETYDKSQEKFDNRINDINLTIKNSEIPIYIYYIEKDTDINFNTNQKSYIYEKIKEKVNSDNITKFEINYFNDFKNYFYKTDHHWNYNGSYKAYTELVDFLNLGNAIKPISVSCDDNPFTGSKANISGASMIYSEIFCVNNYEIPKRKVYINNQLSNNYGNDNLKSIDKITYAEYYGTDFGEVIFDYSNSQKQNILIIGESYDNAILSLLSTHFNKTFSIDLRQYEKENGKTFNYKNYIEKNNIDKILLIGNIDFFRMDEFNLEVTNGI